VREYAANVIAENILQQVDPNGRHSHALDEIVGHKKDGHAVSNDVAFVVTRRGQRKLHHTTKG
jgi:hypothetical protein